MAWHFVSDGASRAALRPNARPYAYAGVVALPAQRLRSLTSLCSSIERINRVVKIKHQVLVAYRGEGRESMPERDLPRYANLGVHSRRPRRFWKRCPGYPCGYNLSF